MGLLSWVFGKNKANQAPVEPHKPQGAHQLPGKPGESDSDMRWRALIQEGIKHANENQMGLYRDTRLDMSQFLLKEGKLRDALNHLLEVNYLDLNGATNAGTKRWDRSDVFLAPQVVEWTAEVARHLGLSMADIEETFLQTARRHQVALKAPVAPERAWSKLRAPLNKQLGDILKAEADHQAKEAAREAKRAEKEVEKAAAREAKAQERAEKKAEKEAAKAEAKAAAPRRTMKPAVPQDQPALFASGDESGEG